MRKAVLLAALIGALFLVYAGGVLAQPQTPTPKIPDRYIVVFEDSVQNPAAVANEHARENGLQVRFVYTDAIEGYAAVFPNAQALQRVGRPEGRLRRAGPGGKGRRSDGALGHRQDRC